ncbi:fused MFS/spermidine synthase [Malonomonas rubra]|uniref:fused MFS/spermidine synthase n=1 Tax=Malonomonas rubra TaxID=57040 RepID=UPI0026F16630|nr:fused MFS/spermidine synthase [Malonomonas rubra]
MQSKRFTRTVIYFLFGLSGFSALVYEILWTKHLILTFGATMPAVSMVAATFMTGLALGGFLFGRLADRSANLFRLYALLELGIVISAVGFPVALHGVEHTYLPLSQVFPDNPLLINFSRQLFAALLLLPPTVCMGGTLPVVSRLFIGPGFSAPVGRLYALNTVGAVAGCFGAAFWLIPSFGLAETGVIAVAINLSIALAFWWRARRPVAVRDTVVGASLPPASCNSTECRCLLFCVAFLGALGLGYEILWTRVFLLFLGNTTFAFAIILGIYLTGLSLGGALYARWLSRLRNRHRLFQQLMALAGLFILATAPFYDRLAYLFQQAHQQASGDWGTLCLLNVAIVAAVILIPTTLSGALLPAAVGLYSSDLTHAGENVGIVILCNTLGAVVGSVLAGFLLIPWVGLLGSFRLLALLNLLLAFAYLLRFKKQLQPVGKLVPSLVLGLLLALVPLNWNPLLMNTAVYYYAPMIAKVGGLDAYIEDTSLVDVEEGIETTVAVKEYQKRIRFFSVNGKTDGSTGRDMSTQVLVGQLPMLLKNSPKNALVIGLGTGATLNEVVSHPKTQIDCIEISPEVVRVAPFFSTVNGHAWENPRTHLVIQDARQWLLTRNKRYDVIISEPSNPWQTGNANLFTSDFYQIAVKRLTPGGVFCQWLPLYDLSLEQLRIAIRTFIQAFPETTAFINGTDFILLGSRVPQAFNLKKLNAAMANPRIAARLARFEFGSAGSLLASAYFSGTSVLQSFSAGAALNSDNHPWLEYSPQMGYSTFNTNFAQLINARRRQGPQLPPLTHLGDTPEETRRALKSLALDFFRVELPDEANILLRQAKGKFDHR